MKLLLKCPKCGHQMHYQPLRNSISGKRKICVYCGKGYTIKDHILKRVG